MLVYFQRITGQSYRFWNFGQRMDLSLKLVLIFLNSILFIATISDFYFAFEDLQNMSKTKNFFSSHKSIMPYIMQISVYICYVIINVYAFLLIQFRGKTILEFLYDIDINIDKERKIGIKAIVLQITVTFLLSLLYFLCYLKEIYFQNNILINFGHFLIIIILFSNYLSLLSLMAYFSYVIQERLTDLQNEFISLQQLPNIFKQLFVIQSYVKKFDQYYNKFLFIIIIIYSFECIDNLTILYFDRYKTMFCPIPTIFESLLSIFIFCYLSDKIYKSYLSIINEYEQLQLKMLDTQLVQFNHSHQIHFIRLYLLRDDMCFTAFNLYPLNMKTFMSILSTIITFTVILIQTRD